MKAPITKSSGRSPHDGGLKPHPAPPGLAPISDDGGQLIQRLQAPVFFAFFFLILWQWIDVHLIYHGGGVVRGFPVFFRGWDFARELLRYPGGATEYLSALVAQSMHTSWLGALVLTLQAWLIVACFREFLRQLGSRRLSVSAFTPPLIILALYGRYSHASVPITGLAIALSALWLHQVGRELSVWKRYALVLASIGLLYFLTPAGLVVYSFAVAIQETRQRTTLPTAVIALCGLLVVPYVGGVWLSGLGISEAYEKLLPVPHELKLLKTSDNIAVGLLYLAVPLLGAAVVLWQAIAARRLIKKPEFSGPEITNRRPAPTETKKTRASPEAGVVQRPMATWPVAKQSWYSGWETCGLVIAALVILRLTHHSAIKWTLAADDFAWHGEWEKALAAARSAPGNIFLAATTVQALFHTGRLAQELPEVNTADDMLLTKEGPLAYWRKSDIYYDIGYVNMALHYLVESVEFWGERPQLLERLATLNLALGNINTAKIYLKALLRAPFHANQARERLHALESDPHGDREPEVSRLRGLMLKADSVVRLSAEEELLSFLEANPRNRMAFEYLMTHYLLTRNLTAFLKNLRRTQEFPGFELSPLWKEAMVIAVSQSLLPVELKGLPPDPDAKRRYEQMLEIISSCGGDKTLARSKLNYQYANSYFYYYHFGR